MRRPQAGTRDRPTPTNGLLDLSASPCFYRLAGAPKPLYTPPVKPSASTGGFSFSGRIHDFREGCRKTRPSKGSYSAILKVGGVLGHGKIAGVASKPEPSGSFRHSKCL